MCPVSLVWTRSGCVRLVGQRAFISAENICPFTEASDPPFLLILLSHNITLVRMLLDHKAETGYRYVDHVVPLGRKDLVPRKEWKLARTFLILQFEPRSRKRSSSEPAETPFIVSRNGEG